MTDDRCEGAAEKKSAVYYDGSCPMCSAIINKIDSSPKGDEFSMRDIKKEVLPADFTRQDVEREMHVVDADGKIYKNAEAILKLLEVYPAWKFVVTVGRLPVVARILPIGYNFVAANRHFLFGAASRVYWLKFLVALGLICGLLLSPKLWVSSRFYPLTPMAEIFPPIPYPLDWLLLLLLFGLLAATIVSRRSRPFIGAAVALLSLLVFLDQQRLQPWVYQYGFMLAALGIFSWKFDDVEGRNATLNVCRFIVASIYFYSGLQKLNLQFFHHDFPWMIAPIRQLFPASAWRMFNTFDMLVPIIEMGIGIGLLIRALRKIAIVLALAMCTFVLWTIGPFGYNWDSVVWPWNITMALLVLILFAKTDSVPTGEIFLVRNHKFHKVALVVFGLLPLASFFNAWDSYLSWSLYSGTTNNAVIYMSEDDSERLPSYVQQLERVDDRGRYVLPINMWAFAELNVPAYPEPRIFKSVARSVCKGASNPPDIVLVMSGRLSWFYRDRAQILTCVQLNDLRTGL